MPSVLTRRLDTDQIFSVYLLKITRISLVCIYILAYVVSSQCNLQCVRIHCGTVHALHVIVHIMSNQGTKTSRSLWTGVPYVEVP